MENISIAREIQDLYDDQELLGKVNDENHWFVTEEWREKFNKHLERLLPIAEKGNALAQCEVANIYYLGYLYSSEQDAIDHYPSNIEMATKWWLKSIHGGIYSALDVLMVSGVGPETDRLRIIYKKNIEKFTRADPPSEDWEKDMRQLYTIAYKNS